MKMTSPCEKVIRRDITRTYPEHPLFKELHGPGQESLFNVIKVRHSIRSVSSMCDGFILGLFVVRSRGGLLSRYGLHCRSSPHACECAVPRLISPLNLRSIHRCRKKKRSPCSSRLCRITRCVPCTNLICSRWVCVFTNFNRWFKYVVLTPRQRSISLSLSLLRQELLPDLHRHFQQEHFHPSMYASSWFLTLFTTQFPLTMVCRTMDLFLSEVDD